MALVQENSKLMDALKKTRDENQRLTLKNQNLESKSFNYERDVRSKLNQILEAMVQNDQSSSELQEQINEIIAKNAEILHTLQSQSDFSFNLDFPNGSIALNRTHQKKSPYAETKSPCTLR